MKAYVLKKEREIEAAQIKDWGGCQSAGMGWAKWVNIEVKT